MLSGGVLGSTRSDSHKGCKVSSIKTASHYCTKDYMYVSPDIPLEAMLMPCAHCTSKDPKAGGSFLLDFPLLFLTGSPFLSFQP